MQNVDDPPLGFQEPPAHFTSATQIARHTTERWAGPWLSCPNCGRRGLDGLPNNSPAGDFVCPDCAEEFELRSSKKPFGRKVLDGAYGAMRQRLLAKNNPNLLLLRYEPETRSATDLIVVPKHFFVLDAIQERKPLAPTARRAGWIGCNILLDRIPAAGRIALLKDRIAVPAEIVREQWRQTLFLREASINARGWLLDVMQVVDAIGRPEFELADVYAAEARLQALYPGNANVRPKIRQQLQVLRDAGYLRFLGAGRYRLGGVPQE